MARKARIKSSTGIYHVLVRAISDLSLFSDEEDTSYYTTIMNDLQYQGRCEIYAYALFPTHVHLLVKAAHDATTIPESSPSRLEPIGSIMKRIASAYSYFFNVKYDHYGPIYLDRFKSNPVETRDYFLKVLDHIGSQDCECKFTCRHIPSGLSDSTNHQPSTINPRMLDYSERPKRITDSRLLAFLRENYSFTNIGEFLQRPEEDIIATIKAAKNIGGSIRQIVRLTGTPYQVVFHLR